MRYRELVQFEPIETVIQLRQADDKKEAEQLVKTFVVSERMAEHLRELIIPNLQFDTPADNKGLMVVGNYGTGKSHLMAVISAIAEHKEMQKSLAERSVRNACQKIAGRFKVVRTEIGATEMPLREILCGELQKHLSRMKVKFDFPSANKVVSNKDAVVEMMAAFHKVYPDHGLLLVVDELLDYLRSRREQELTRDLVFLRELGETCRLCRLRFMAGMQESLFDSPRFQFVASSVQRVKDRFEQIRIVRQDVAYVVSQRLLQKTEDQRASIREHLQKFARLYDSLSERMEEFCSLFPVHPAFLTTFERVYVAEKREVLKTVSAEMKKLLNEDVPENEPGLIAYDSYWGHLRDNPSFRAIPDVREVIDKSQVLAGRVQQAFTRPQYKPVALRIIDALSVHRLTTGDIHVPIGSTARELRDDLCIFLPMPERDAEFLKTTVETVLREISKTVSGQFLSFNSENGQWYLDLKKDVDFGSQIELRGDSLSGAQLDGHYFDVLKQVMLEDPGLEPYVSGYRIWEYELEWSDRKVTRQGYLFFGAPNQRSTAQPPQDFYMYFLPIYDRVKYEDEKKSDEVFFELGALDEDFERHLKLYAGAREMSTESAAHRKIYLDKADEHLRSLTKWLQTNAAQAYKVTHKGVTKKFADLAKGAPSGRATVREMVNKVAAACLSTHFEDQAPNYPKFPILITQQTRDQAAQEAIRWIAGSLQTQQGAQILDALELLEGATLRPENSRYAKHILGLLRKKGEGQVLNRSEIIRRVHPQYELEYEIEFCLEPEWVVVILGALVHSGDIILSLPGKTVDASGLEEIAGMRLSDLVGFKHIQRPKELPLAALQALFDMLGIPRGLVTNEATREEAVQQMQKAVLDLTAKGASVDEQVRGGIPCWGGPLLDEKELDEYGKRLGELKKFLESLQAYNTPGKLKHFKHSKEQVTAQKAGLELLKDVEQLAEMARDVMPLGSYLSNAESLFPEADDWVKKVKEERARVLTGLKDPAKRGDSAFRREVAQKLSALKKEYVEAYLGLHGRARLGKNDDQKKGELAKDPRIKRLNKLANVEMLSRSDLEKFREDLGSLKTCFSLTSKDLESSQVCPHCNFRPREEPVSVPAKARLSQLENQLDAVEHQWTQALLRNLEDPTVKDLGALKAKQKKLVLDFVKKGALPDDVNGEFVKALQDAFAGLEKVVVTLENLKAALTEGGTPCTPEELRKRLDGYIESLTRGKDATKVRIVLE